MWKAVMMGKSAFIGDLRHLKYLVMIKRHQNTRTGSMWVYEEREQRKLEPLAPMELNGRQIKEEEPLPDIDELVYERSLFTGLLQLYFTREDGKPIVNKREAKTIYKL